MAYVFLGYDNSTRELIAEVQHYLEQHRIQTWLPSPDVDWSLPSNTILLMSVVRSASAAVVMATGQNAWNATFSANVNWLESFDKPLFVIQHMGDVAPLVEVLHNVLKQEPQISPLPLPHVASGSTRRGAGWLVGIGVVVLLALISVVSVGLFNGMVLLPFPGESSVTPSQEVNFYTVTSEPSDTAFLSATFTLTVTPSITASSTATQTPTSTLSATNTLTRTATMTPSLTVTPTALPTLTATPVNTPISLPDVIATNTSLP